MNMQLQFFIRAHQSVKMSRPEQNEFHGMAHKLKQFKATQAIRASKHIVH